MAQISTTNCGVCKENVGEEFCYECKHFLCQSCKVWHDKFQKGHTLTKSHMLDRLVLTKKHDCDKHDEDFVFYCTSCETLICTSCVTADHQGHQLTNISTVATEARKSMKASAEIVEKKIKTLAGLIKSLKVTQLKQAEDESDHFLAEVNDSYKDIKTIIQSIKKIEVTGAADFLVLSKEEIEKAAAMLEKIHADHVSTNKNLQKAMQQQHDKTFLINQKELKKQVDDLDDIPKLDEDEPNRIRKFNREEFAKSIVEEVQSVFKIRLKTDISDSKEKDDKTGSNRSTKLESVSQREKDVQCAQLKLQEECVALESALQTQKKEYLALKESYDYMVQKYEAEITKRDQADKPVKDIWSITQDDQEDRLRQLKRQIKARDEEIRDLKESNKKELQQQEREFLALKESYDDMVQKYEAEVTRNDEIQERAEKPVRQLRRRAKHDQGDTDRQLRRQIKDRDEQIRDLKESNRRELQEQEQELNRLRDELKQKEHDITFAHSDRNLGFSNTRAVEKQEEQLRLTTMQLEQHEEKLRHTSIKLREREDEITSLRSEKDSALSRLSKEMGDKLSANNPGVADLSDPNRSTKVAELYGSVYDNEWTHALECLTHQGTDEETGVRFLLEIMKHIYSLCTKAKEEMMQDLQGRFSNPISGGGYTDDRSPEDKQIKQMLDSCVKMKARTAISNVHKSYSQIKPTNKPKYADRLPEYVSKCMEICWLMNTQSPSLIFAEPLQFGETIDMDQYKEYTKQGDVVSFVVWLPLLMEQDGAVLSKGVVQPLPRSSVGKSERRRSSKRDSVKSRSQYESPRESRDKRFKEVVDEVTRDQRERYRYDSSGEIGRDRDNRTMDRDLYSNDLSGDRLHANRYTGSRLSPTPTGSSVDELFQDSRRHSSYTTNTDYSTPPLSRSHSPNISNPVYRSEYSYSSSVPSHTTSKQYYGDKTTTSRVTERPTSDYTNHRKTAADYSKERAQTIGVARPESDKNTLSHIDSSDIFAFGGHNYTLQKGRLYKQDHSGGWRFTSQLGDS